MNAIEQAAKAIVREEGILDWDVLGESLRDYPRGLARAGLSAACTVAVFVRVQAEHEFRSRGSSSYLCSCRQVIPVAPGNASWTERAAAALHWHRAEEIRAELLGERL